ncbi:alternative ribosome rescue aminoacyl-tRNA hydrolase ArfB [Dyadobacter sp. Leaf189]|uniref:alternative ribosome rescue aminoacyl-tRNA hydrolase ArfB n=1 Tax=Dyadobacter sp. Leaf189 TaxID=1736295 RepID=UPI0007013DB7|nr:alternative ribosome rescue aminoacyl-tRNA hydrolase ArfB [Dyadobacter sp. Leaf189]KQS33298.1 peptide chain release factor 1 [Dyadobacter sp. Leaf189]
MINPDTLHNELTFQTARSGGAGGQNVNKVETKVELRFDILHSTVLTDEQKQMLIEKLASKLTNDKVLVLYHQTERSQLANKDKVIAKFDQLIKQAFTVKKSRKPTRPTNASRLERLKDKQRNAIVKSLRKKTFED